MISTKHLWALVSLTLITLPSCKKASKEAQEDRCISDLGSVISGSSGKARVFVPDPMGSAKDESISPKDYNLDQYATPVTLENLSGHGVLHGDYVHVGQGVCNGDYASFSSENDFSYTHGNKNFSDAMTYHYGSSYRKSLDSYGYLSPPESTWMVTDCTDDNAFFYRDPFGGTQLVCMGVSSSISGASFTDDASVAIHELQHSTTVNTYSPIFDLNQLHYDEAGGLNEALSDFMALTYTAPLLPAGFDPKTFSRWALGTFFGDSSARGAHRCPQYDPEFPNCSSFPSFDSSKNKISYIYPDGMGWPYATSETSDGKLQAIYDAYRGVEEIHNIGNLMEGALWDVYESIKVNHGGSAEVARQLTSQLVLEAVKLSPKPSKDHVSPVTFRRYSSALIDAAAALNWSSSDRASLRSQLVERGLVDGPALDSNWARRDPTHQQDEYVHITDSPSKLKSWIGSLGGKTSMIPQNTDTGLNNRMDPGEVVLVWFNIQNTSATTAGAVELAVESLDPEVTLLTDENGVHYNIGAVSNSVAQIQYGKINGNDIVTSLSKGGILYAVPTGNTYFLTNPYYYRSLQTGIWLKVSQSAAHGKQITLRVKATPSNGSTSTVDFPLTIQ